MKRVALALFGTVAGLVMLLNFKTHTSTASIPAAVATTGPNTGGTTSGSGTSSSGTSSAPTSGTSASKAASSTGTKTVTGDSVDTRWGPVQVQITVTNGKITAVQAVDFPQNNGRDQEINSYAIPALNQEALAAGSAQIDSISGATVTSGGYISSLQSAIDKAGL
jgi:uncharacterized protein with FMN-binding domain